MDEVSPHDQVYGDLPEVQTEHSFPPPLLLLLFLVSVEGAVGHRHEVLVAEGEQFVKSVQEQNGQFYAEHVLPPARQVDIEEDVPTIGGFACSHEQVHIDRHYQHFLEQPVGLHLVHGHQHSILTDFL